VLERAFPLRQQEGENKVVGLTEAIRQNIRPGMRLHFAREANAAVAELLRQHRGSDAKFTVVMAGALGYVLNLVHCGLVDRLITTMSTHLHPTPGPVRMLQKASKEGKLTIENWSMWTLTQRLIAGAWGVPFLPTNSLLGTGTAKDNADQFLEMDDPFGTGRRCGVVKALDVDVSIIHACAADAYGNALLPAPYDDTIWAPRAAKSGVIVTAEQIVSTDFIREHAAMVRLPGYLVNAVCHVPFGSHPINMVNPCIRSFVGYGSDYDFMAEYRRVLDDPAALDAWIKEWILDCQTHDKYTAKLGQERLQILRDKADKNAWQGRLKSVSQDVSAQAEFNDTEMMIVAGARKIRERVIAGGYRTMLTGIGAAGLAAWLAYLKLLDEGYGMDMIFGSGQYGFSPRPGDPYMFNVSNMPTCKMLCDFSDVYGVFAGGATNKCLVILGVAQIDKNGNLNSSKIGGNFLIGAGGATDAVSSKEILIVSRQAANRFMDQVPYIGCPGDKVMTVVTNIGVMEKLSQDKEFTLTQVCPQKPGASDADIVKQAIDNCGWKLNVASKVGRLLPPTAEELATLRLLDPEGAYIKG
jgi:acyl CoA:acetate/3-ketoacid CoA transferase alpha subunit/acyl CoA:acetate/3-ketoacid CoA transferase beta subunit